MLALKDNCVHPETKQPYVKTGKGGKDNSPEGRQVSPPPGGRHDDCVETRVSLSG